MKLMKSLLGGDAVPGVRVDTISYETPSYYRVLGEADPNCHEVERVVPVPGTPLWDFHLAELVRRSGPDKRLFAIAVGNVGVTAVWHPYLAFNDMRCCLANHSAECSWSWGRPHLFSNVWSPTVTPISEMRKDESGEGPFHRLLRTVQRRLLDAVLLEQVRPDEQQRFAALIAKGLDNDDPLGRRFLAAVIPHWTVKKDEAGLVETMRTEGMVGGRFFRGSEELKKFQADWQQVVGRPFTEADTYGFDRAVADWTATLA